MCRVQASLTRRGRSRGVRAFTRSAYICRTALGNQRILRENNGRITFKCKDSGDQSWRTLTLSPHEFLRRFLQDVLPKDFPRVRYYGWLRPAAKARWQGILALLDWQPPAGC